MLSLLFDWHVKTWRSWLRFRHAHPYDWSPRQIRIGPLDIVVTKY